MFSFITRLIPAPYLLAGIAAVLAVTHGFAYFQGRQSGKETYYEFKAKVDAANMRLALQSEHRQREQERIDQTTRQGWVAAVDYWRGHPVVRVQRPRCAGGVPGVSVTPREPDETAPQSGPGPLRDVTVEECEARLNDAVLDAAQVVHLQQFVLRQHEVP